MDDIYSKYFPSIKVDEAIKIQGRTLDLAKLVLGHLSIWAPRFQPDVHPSW